MTVQQKIGESRLDAPPRSGQPGEKPTFAKDTSFHAELRRRVDEYFRSSGRRPRDCPSMYLKTAILLAFFAVVYGLLVFVAQEWWQAVPLAVLLGLAAAAIGFNVQHDGGHHAYSDYSWVNKLMAMTLDVLGGSSYLWHMKHVVYHHTYPNIAGHDTDIDLGFLGRLAPSQNRLWFHRWQHYYLWPLYGFQAITWHFYADFRDILTGKIGGHSVARPKGTDLVVFLAGKVAFACLAFVVPMLLHSALTVFLFYALATAVTGIVLSVVFQLAHCVEEAAFPLPIEDSKRIAHGWAIHQVETTVDFSRSSKLVSWLLGGLNFQIEHHLFPRICHVNYPAIAKVVEATCREMGVRYLEHRSIASGIASHFRWLRRMGTMEAVG